MARDNKLDHLANVRLFSNLTKRELATVGRASDEISVDAGRLLVRNGPGFAFVFFRFERLSLRLVHIFLPAEKSNTERFKPSTL